MTCRASSPPSGRLLPAVRRRLLPSGREQPRRHIRLLLRLRPEVTALGRGHLRPHPAAFFLRSAPAFFRPAASAPAAIFACFCAFGPRSPRLAAAIFAAG